MNIDPGTSLGLRLRGYTPAAPDISQDMPEWMQGALCTQVDPELFYPEHGVSARDAKAVCGACEFKPECLTYALDNDERWGVWGGMSEAERRRIRRPGAFRCPESGCGATFRHGNAIGGHRSRVHGYRIGAA